MIVRNSSFWLRDYFWIIIFYFLFYFSFIWKIGQFIGEWWGFCILIAIFIVLPILIWTKIIFHDFPLKNKFDVFVKGFLLAFPYGHMFIAGFYLMGHKNFDLHTIIFSIPYGGIISFVFAGITMWVWQIRHYLIEKFKKS